MSFDTTCRRLAEQFSPDFASWLLGYPVELTELNPTELSLEPIRADALILLQSNDLILHGEFQTDPDADIPFRMLDYRVRGQRHHPKKRMHQVVIYLRRSGSPLVEQTTYDLERTHHEFDVIRLWEQPPEIFFQFPGLLPFAVLAQTPEPQETLLRAAQAIQQIPDTSLQAELTAAAFVLAGLVLDKAVVETIIRRDIMQASVTYQAIKQEGEQEGRKETLEEVALKLASLNMTMELIAQTTGLSEAAIQQLLAQGERPEQS
jgi:predicted transposase/invertase (TIGR01784 family)